MAQCAPLQKVLLRADSRRWELVTASAHAECLDVSVRLHMTCMEKAIQQQWRLSLHYRRAFVRVLFTLGKRWPHVFSQGFLHVEG